MEYKFIIKKRYDNGIVNVLKEGVTEDYITAFEETITEHSSLSSECILRNITDYGRGYFSFRVWDYSYTLEIFKM